MKLAQLCEQRQLGTSQLAEGLGIHIASEAQLKAVIGSDCVVDDWFTRGQANRLFFNNNPQR